MNDIFTISNHWIALGLAVVLTSVSQILFRVGAKDQAKLASLVNWKILLGYLLFCIVVLLTIYALQAISLRSASAMTSITYILVPLMAYKFVKDPISVRIIIGSIIICIGVIVFFI